MDPIADMLAIIKNALNNRETEVTASASKIKSEILDILKQQKYILDFKKTSKNNKNYFLIKLKYDNKKPVISHLKRISKPGLRIYRQYKNIPRPLSGLGMVIISTPKGVMSGKEAVLKKIGGEIICEIY
ncbi:30S ribosomal protein S8 [Candidatus Berkelbacteria bacterium RIFCSPHIGHO2_12_FULL_36_9]|uniref:Small ribosomal subunit protein uS8 n=1 Tax=Candidatus Berkelbacteria bacterium RIFCSPHIGHO2_12_FULL_36_9 TaxID=1797469 RepID=A0A1F5EE27_9BACT|nr:MAG: 30S ribosomal protein S8 [Candidatus Berkelbacteria bacterium RIFCSPHIGHO2_12_FULL_36_9]